AEDGIRDFHVTGVQTCALPIWRRSSRVTIAVTWALSAWPDPVTAALPSLGVYVVTGRPARAPARTATAPACAVPITVRTLCWLKIGRASCGVRVMSIVCGDQL